MNGNNMNSGYQHWIPPTYSAPPPPSNSAHARSRATGNQAMNRPALPSALSHLQQQAQQHNQLAAAAAASMSSVLNTKFQPQIPDRTMVNYSDYVQSSYQSYKEYQFQCAECNKAYEREQQFRSHMRSHVQCSQCEFSAIKHVVDLHEESFHGTVKPNKRPSRPDGVVPPNAPKLDTPEDLRKWIEERKRNWPSQKNIERKKQEREEKIARGELAPEDKSSKRKAGQYGDNTKKRSRLSNNQDTQPSEKTQPATNSVTNVVHPLSGLADYGSDSDNQNSDDDIMDPEKDAISSKDPSSVGVIALPSASSQKQKRNRVCRYFQKGKCTRGDSCIFLHESRPRPPRNAAQQPPVEMFRTRSGLLEKLLEKDIKNEKSMLLQCLRYIVQNDFFGVGSASK